MVPGSYHGFFAGCVSVAGTLIGLLFVAISMSPHKDAAGKTAIGFQLQAGVAFTTLINTLVVALVALLPDDSVEVITVALAGAGISSSIGLTIVSLQRRPTRRQLQQLVIIPLLGVLSVLQLLTGISLMLRPTDPHPVSILALLLIAFIVIAIRRAWKMIGARNNLLVAVIADLVREQRATLASSVAGKEDKDGRSLRPDVARSPPSPKPERRQWPPLGRRFPWWPPAEPANQAPEDGDP
jgi:hypothetical protein